MSPLPQTSRRWLWGIALATVFAAVAALAGATTWAVQRTFAAPPVREVFPNALLVSESAEVTLPPVVAVTRTYQTVAPYRVVVAWYYGKDSLMPLPPTLPGGCFRQQYYHGGAEEDVLICSSGSQTAITSVTMTRFKFSLISVFRR